MCGSGYASATPRRREWGVRQGSGCPAGISFQDIPELRADRNQPGLAELCLLNGQQAGRQVYAGVVQADYFPDAQASAVHEEQNRARRDRLQTGPVPSIAGDRLQQPEQIVVGIDVGHERRWPFRNQDSGRKGTSTKQRS